MRPNPRRQAGPSAYERELRQRRAEAQKELWQAARDARAAGNGSNAGLFHIIAAHAAECGFDATIGVLKSALATMGEQRHALDRLAPVVDRNGQASMF